MAEKFGSRATSGIDPPPAPPPVPLMGALLLLLVAGVVVVLMLPPPLWWGGAGGGAGGKAAAAAGPSALPPLGLRAVGGTGKKKEKREREISGKTIQCRETCHSLKVMCHPESFSVISRSKLPHEFDPALR